jgi:hypothetical protein
MVKHIATKRTSKKETLDDVRQRFKSPKPLEDDKKVIAHDLTRRHKHKKHNQRLKDIDINIGHKIDEVRLLPFNFAEDSIGTRRSRRVG